MNAAMECVPHTVYRAVDRSGRALYVGCTVNFRSRQAGHRSSSAWYPLLHHWEFETVEGRTAALATEQRLIRELCPRFNVVGNPRSKGRVKRPSRRPSRRPRLLVPVIS